MIELRSLPANLEIRDGRTVVGRAMPYGVETRIGSYVESFTRGAFSGIDPSSVPLTAPHPKDGGELPIGVSVAYREEDDGLYGEWRVSETTFGDDVLALVRDRAVSGLSIGFVPDPTTDVWDQGRTRVVRHRATLDHVAVVRSPAYADARIVAVRSARPRLAIARRAF
jgi:Escherichia/Staphylococcus phage prohead protease